MKIKLHVDEEFIENAVLRLKRAKSFKVVRQLLLTLPKGVSSSKPVAAALKATSKRLKKNPYRAVRCESPCCSLWWRHTPQKVAA